MIVTDIISALSAGKELANAETWKRAQLRTSALVAIISLVITACRLFGWEIPVTPEDINAVALAVGVLGGLFMGVATAVSSKRVGLPARGGNEVPRHADGGGQPATPREWIREHDGVRDDPVPDIVDQSKPLVVEPPEVKVTLF